MVKDTQGATWCNRTHVAILFLLLASALLFSGVVLQLSQPVVAPSFSNSVVLALFVGIQLLLLMALIRSVDIHWQRHQPKPKYVLPASERDWPEVAVVIPCDNEPHHQLEVSLIAASQLNYPRSKLKVYLVDAGISVQQRFQGNDHASANANYRYKALIQLCKRLHIELVDNNQGGSRVADLAHVLQQCQGEYVLVVDPSQIISGQAVQTLLPHLLANEQLAAVQAPCYHGADQMVEQRMSSLRRNVAFKHDIQLDKAGWSAEYLAGRATLLRKSQLLSTETVNPPSAMKRVRNEQAVSISVNSVNNCNEATGKNQASLMPHLLQRHLGQQAEQTKWRKSALRLRALKSISPSLIWACTLLPCVSLLTGIVPLSLLAASIVSVAFIAMAVANWVYQRAFSITELLNHLVNSLIIIMGSMRWLTQTASSRSSAYVPVHKPLGQLLKSFVVLALVAIVVGAVHLVLAPVWRWDLVAMWLLQWSVIALLLAAFASVQPFSQRRAWPRHSMSMPARCEIAGRRYFCEVVNMSVGGMGIELDPVASRFALQGAEVKVYGFAEKEFRDCTFSCNIASVRKRKMLSLGLSILCGTDQEYARMVKLIYGDASRWHHANQTVDQRAEWKAFVMLVMLGARRLLQQFVTACRFRLGVIKKA